MNNKEIIFLALVVLAFLAPVLLVLLIRSYGKLRAIRKRFSAIVDVEAHVARLDAEAAARRQEVEGELVGVRAEILAQRKAVDAVRTDYARKRQTLDQLEAQLAVYDERLSFAELGVYEAHFDFSDSETFKERVRSIRETQKEIVRMKRAVTCEAQWTVEGSAAKGRTMTDRQIRLTLRAFNNECEAAIANTRWNNVNAMEKRIRNAGTQIDKMNASSQVVIEQDYLELKLQELFLTHEYREALKREREERAEAARLAREEQKLVREAAKAQKEEEKYLELLKSAREEILGTDAAGMDRMQERIAGLEADLARAHDASERARSMAEMTRSGYVYVISNVGSFGDEIVKIGLTRRLDPEDRIKELGDASVPFTFDTHAMIYSDDAPSLEAALHAEFDVRRVNAANYRKEFFRVELDEVEQAVARLAPDAAFFKDREAQEYHETLARRQEEAQALYAASDDGGFPNEI